MKTKKTLFTKVPNFYNNLLSELNSADTIISMMYYAFDHGEWAKKISAVLATKAQAGIRVRLMTDELGQILDNPRHILKNQTLINDLKETGVEVEIFRPAGTRLKKINRLHFKVCAIDQRTVFLGGSNIGDHYPHWDDSNLRLDGSLENTFHDIFDYVLKYSKGHQLPDFPEFHLSRLYAGDSQIWMTIPGKRQDIRRAILKLILEAEKEIYIRTWYFLPDKEILNALKQQAEKGVKVYVLLSHKTRVRLIDFANYIHCHNLALSGGIVYRFTEKYMHAKVAWNDHGDVVFGSANLENMAMKNTFECCITVQDQNLARELQRAFESDAQTCFQQTPEIFPKRTIHLKALSYTCNLASPWL